MRQHRSSIAQSARRPAALRVPARMAEHLRAGLYIELGLPGQQVASTAAFRETRRADAYREAICRAQAARDLLDELGWEANRSSVRVDMRKRREFVVKILRQQLDRAVERMRDGPPTELPELERVVSELGDYALHLQSLHV